MYQIGAVYLWTYVYNLIRVLSNAPIETPPSVESNYDNCKVPLISSKEEEDDNHKVFIFTLTFHQTRMILFGSDCLCACVSVSLTGWEVGKSQAKIGFTIRESQP